MGATVGSDDDARLSTLLRDGSRDDHRAAEASRFLVDLMDGRVAASDYADYLARLRRVYRALEDTGRALARDAVVRVVHDPALERLPALDADLGHWGPGSAASAATDAYVQRVESTRQEPLRYLAHHYTRYLGDLAGGQAVGRVLARTFGLHDDGLAFYAFPGIARPRPYREAYRDRLDALDLTASQRGTVLAEVRVVFALNGALLDELAAQRC